LILERLEDLVLPTLFGPPVNYPAGPEPDSVAVGDFNHDGLLDVVTASASGSINEFLGRGDGTFQNRGGFGLGNWLSSLAVGDFNGDGNLDLVVADRGLDRLYILMGNGDGTFQTPRTISVGPDSAPIYVEVGDFNNDGKLDIVTANAYSRTVSVRLGNGDGTFQNPIDAAVGNFPSSVAVGDFNGDGNLDLAVTNYNSATLSVLLGNGDGTFQPQTTYAVGQNAIGAVVADFNGDGHLDIVVADPNDSAVGILLGNGDGTFQAQRTFATDGYSYQVAVADFNGDGKLDLAVGDGSGNAVRVLLGNGDGTFQTEQTFPAGSQPGAVAVGDFNGDLAPDLVAANYSGESISVLLNTSAVATSLEVSTPDTAVAGTPFQTTVTVRNQFGGVFTSYTGTVHFTCTDDTAILPDDYTFTSADHCVHTFTVTLTRAGSQRVTATDHAITGNGYITVNPAAADNFLVQGFPSTSTAGTVNTFAVTVRDAYQNTVTGYRGTVLVTSSDPQAKLPFPYAFTATDNGTHVFEAVLKTAGTQSLTATDAADSTITGTQNGLAVSPAAAAVLRLEAPATVGADTAFDLRVTVEDAYGNIVTDYRGTLQFQSSDAEASLPGPYTFTADDAGVHVFSVTLHDTGLQSIIAFDQQLATLTGLALIIVE
jgi:hypothetical protein